MLIVSYEREVLTLPSVLALLQYCTMYTSTLLTLVGKVISLGEQVQSGIKILGHLIFRQELLLLQQSYPYRSSLGSVVPLALVVLRYNAMFLP